MLGALSRRVAVARYGYNLECLTVDCFGLSSSLKNTPRILDPVWHPLKAAGQGTDV